MQEIFKATHLKKVRTGYGVRYGVHHDGWCGIHGLVDIEATEAVDTLSALGVINGYEDGSFKPNGTVTRAEMAAMIYI